MATKIRITATPPGFAPPHIRKAWVGCELPLATPHQLRRDPPTDVGIGNENNGGHVVLRQEAAKVLAKDGKPDAAAFWSRPFGMYLVFARDVCEEID